MKSLKVLAVVMVLALLAGCGGTGQEQQAGATTPAATPPASEPQPTPSEEPGQASVEPEPARPRPAPRTSQPRPAATPAQPAPSRPTVHMVSVPAGTVMQLALDTAISSKTAQVGDSFAATVLEPIHVEGRDVIPAGSKIEGKVTEAVPAKRGAGNAKLALSFDVLRLKNGFKTNIVGTFQEVTQSKKKRNAGIIGGSAAGGALLGRILGKDTKGAVVGAIVGGGIGTAVVMGKEGEQAKLPADTPFEIRLEEPVRVPHGAERT